MIVTAPTTKRITDQKQSIKPQDLTDFWILQRRWQEPIAFLKLHKLCDLSREERLLAALLRRDEVQAKRIIRDDFSAGNEVGRFIEMVDSMHFSGLIMERLASIGNFDAPIIQAIAKGLNPSASREFVSHLIIKKQLQHLLKLLEKFDSQMMWIKGTSLSRTVYEKPEHRISNDFDLLIEESILEEVTETLIRNEYTPVMVASFCNQIGVGPVNKTTDLLLAPDERWLPVSTLTFGCGAKTLIDLTVSATNRGLRSPNSQLIFDRATRIRVDDSYLLAPDPVYELIIASRNLEKDRFRSWVSLYDVHSVVGKYGPRPGFWSEFVQICKDEHLESSAWSALWLAVDRLSTEVPREVLAELQPIGSWWQKLVMFTVSPTFSWNGASALTLLLSASISTDRSRKLNTLRNSLFPNKEFLKSYYCFKDKPLAIWLAMLFHWFVLACPGGIVRRTPLGAAWTAACLEHFCS